MQEIILTIGLPASGKTTWTDDIIQGQPEYVNVNRDDIRLMLQGRGRYHKFSKWREQLVTDIQFNTAKEALLANKSVIVSDTNLNPTTLSKWETFATEMNVIYTLRYFTDTPLGVCLDRDSKREFPVGSKVITGMFNKYQDLYWPKPVYDNSLPNAYICDIDGTIAHMHNRRPYEWSKVGDDTPKQDVIDIINTLSEAGNTIIICSGRDGIAKEATTLWMDKHNVMHDEFYIRPEGDSRKDYVIKEEIYKNHIKGKFNVVGVLDDRDQVVSLWRHLGLTCLQVDYGNF